jgi:multidrug efflux system outer membrane protein
VRQAGLNTASGMQPATLVTAGLNFSYEADLFGRLSRASEAAREDANAREACCRARA